VRGRGADQSSASSCAELATEFSGVALDMLVNCAGVGGSGPNLADFSRDGQEFGAIDYEAWVRFT
jgi:NAD(P)-dependent dehydrogenase (short-subunit alcohol dehydrogenase family)